MVANLKRSLSSLILLISLIYLIMSPQGAKADSSTMSKAAASTKTIYLIRHAESEENRRISALCRTFQTVKKFSLPKASDITTSTELLNVSAQVDSNVSEVGEKQISHMGEKLRKDNFVEKSEIDLVVHSPLLRARQTSEGMLGCMTASSSDDSVQEKRASTVSRVTETALLLEKTLAEWTPVKSGDFYKRINTFESWLGEQPEETIAIVGHSQFFKAMLGLDYKFGNCEVWKVDFNAESSSPGAETDEAKSGQNTEPSVPSLCWSNLRKLYGCDVESSPRTV